MTVAWYVHHQGAGHGARLVACAPHLGAVVAFGSGARPGQLPSCVRWETLDPDLDDCPVDATAGGALHWAPLGHPGHRSRMARIAATVEAEAPAVFVIDVSVEVTALARLLGVPTVSVAQRGHRHDAPHRLGYGLASSVVATWTAQTHRAGTGLPDARLRFVGAISRFDDRPVPKPAAQPVVSVLVGSGGHDITADDVAAAAAATPEWSWHVAGALRVPDARLSDHGPDADVWSLLARSSVVVGTAGGNVVAEVAAARRPFICLPQRRPFGEQACQADALAHLPPVTVRRRWPTADAWPALLERAARSDVAGWSALHDRQGASRLAAVIHETAR